MSETNEGRLHRLVELFRHCLNKFEALLEDHRSDAYLTCPKDCWCWDLDRQLIALENIYQDMKANKQMNTIDDM